MSIDRRPREMGIIIRCDGTDEDYCKATVSTANCRADANRSYAKSQGWGRGLRKGHKRNDLCPKCLAIETKLARQEAAMAEQRKLERAQVKKDRLDAKKPLPKKRRKKKPRADAEVTNIGEPGMSSPSADSAPVPAT